MICSPMVQKSQVSSQRSPTWRGDLGDLGDLTGVDVNLLESIGRHLIKFEYAYCIYIYISVY